MSPEEIVLISFGLPDRELMENIEEGVKKRFILPVKTRFEHPDIIDFYDPARNQYNGNFILKKIETEFASDFSKTIGLFNVDLFIPILTYIFGQAYLNGRTGIASLFRLRNEIYGVRRNDIVMSERFRKEVIHELGHMFGLIHCTEILCVMRSSTYVEDIDQKSDDFCDRCYQKLSGRLNHPA